MLPPVRGEQQEQTQQPPKSQVHWMVGEGQLQEVAMSAVLGTYSPQIY